MSCPQLTRVRVARAYAVFDTRTICARSYDGRMRVLIVEDEPLLAEAVRDGLRLEAISADIARDGDSALEALSVTEYDIALIDRDIPGPSGDEVARRIVASGEGPAILMLTAADRLDVLSPLQRITAATRATAAGSLSHRIRMTGRDDEFGELADAFDSMLARIESHVAEQRRFAANASHELRTPLSVMRSVLDVARDDPDADPRVALERLAATNDRAIAVAEALLA